MIKNGENIKRDLRIIVQLDRKPYFMPVEDVARELNHDVVKCRANFAELILRGRLEVASEFYDAHECVDVLTVRLPKCTEFYQAHAC